MEFVHREVAAHITQRELGAGAAAALRQSRHLDADVIALDRVENAADLAALLDAAEAGRLVLAVVDATTPERAIERVVQLVPSQGRALVCERLAAVLRAASCQQLVHDEDGAARLQTTVRKLGPADVQALRENRLPDSSHNGSVRS